MFCQPPLPTENIPHASAQPTRLLTPAPSFSASLCFGSPLSQDPRLSKDVESPALFHGGTLSLLLSSLLFAPLTGMRGRLLPFKTLSGPFLASQDGTRSPLPTSAVTMEDTNGWDLGDGRLKEMSFPVFKKIPFPRKKRTKATCT